MSRFQCKPGDVVEFGFDGDVTGEAVVTEVHPNRIAFDRSVAAMAMVGGQIRLKGSSDGTDILPLDYISPL